MENIVLDVGGMSCQHCVNAVKSAVEEAGNAKAVDISLNTGKVAIEYDPTKITIEEIINAITEEGYEVK